MTKLLCTAFAISLTSYLAGCSSSSDDGGTGGTNGLGGKGSGGASNGGAVGNGGSSGGAPSGGSAQGGAPGSGGQSSGGKSNGGSSAGGASGNSGGAATGGGSQAKGGANSGGAGGGSAGSNTGGRANTGGASATGGTSAGGGASGGTGSGTGGGGQTCPMPSTFKWTSGGPAANAASGWDSIKDFNYATINGKHLIYMSMHSGSSYGGAMMSFTDWPGAATATQTKLSFAAVAPSIFYFTPKQTWVLAYQWGPTGFTYRTSSDPLNASGWSGEKSLYPSKTVPGSVKSDTGVIDQTVICDAAKCYLFFAGDNGCIYRSSMDIGSFPGEFPVATTIMQETAQSLFEGVQVYTIKGSNKYLMLVEAQGNGGRYFRAWTATDLGGSWTLLTNTFAAKSNTTFSQNWTNDISHGDLVRSGGDETIPIDPCNLQMIFQGRDPNSTAAYDKLPYKLGLLTAAK